MRSQILFNKKNSQDVRDYAAEKGLAVDDAISAGMAEQAKVFCDTGARLYTEV